MKIHFFIIACIFLPKGTKKKRIREAIKENLPTFKNILEKKIKYISTTWKTINEWTFSKKCCPFEGIRHHHHFCISTLTRRTRRNDTTTFPPTFQDPYFVIQAWRNEMNSIKNTLKGRTLGL